MSVNIPNVHKIYQHFPISGPPKFTQIESFGLKRNHQETLVVLPPLRGLFEANSKLSISCRYELCMYIHGQSCKNLKHNKLPEGSFKRGLGRTFAPGLQAFDYFFENIFYH
jgi:hypothetical protein